LFGRIMKAAAAPVGLPWLWTQARSVTIRHLGALHF
jgi:hypothetical protein